jgi:hypothetical protein
VKAIAGAIVVLAGAVLIGAGSVAGNNGDGAIILGAVVGLIGLSVFLPAAFSRQTPRE